MLEEAGGPTWNISSNSSLSDASMKDRGVHSYMGSVEQYVALYKRFYTACANHVLMLDLPMTAAWTAPDSQPLGQTKQSWFG